jgi:hypothetical protein
LCQNCNVGLHTVGTHHKKFGEKMNKNILCRVSKEDTQQSIFCRVLVSGSRRLAKYIFKLKKLCRVSDHRHLPKPVYISLTVRVFFFSFPSLTLSLASPPPPPSPPPLLPLHLCHGLSTSAVAPSLHHRRRHLSTVPPLAIAPVIPRPAPPASLGAGHELTWIHASFPAPNIAKVRRSFFTIAVHNPKLDEILELLMLR